MYKETLNKYRSIVLNFNVKFCSTITGILIGGAIIGHVLASKQITF